MEYQNKGVFVGENAGYIDIGSNNIILGNGANTDYPTDSYMFVVGTWKYKMTPEEYKEIHKAIIEVAATILEHKDEINNKFTEWLDSLPMKEA